MKETFAAESMKPVDASAAKRSRPFGAYGRPDEDVHFEIVKGLVAVVHGPKEQVLPCLLFGVVEGDDGYSIASFWHIAYPDVPWLHKMYGLKTLRRFAHTGELTEVERGLTYDDMVNRIHERHEELEVPDKAAFYKQFGIEDGDLL